MQVRERVEVKSPVRANCTPGSVRGAPGNRRPYLADADELRQRRCHFPAGVESLLQLSGSRLDSSKASRTGRLAGMDIWRGQGSPTCCLSSP